MKLRLAAACTIAAVSLSSALLAPRCLRTAFADDPKDKGDKKKDKDKEKDEKESKLENGDARAALQKVQKKIDAGSFQDALSAARELVDKHGDDLVRLEDKDEATNDKFDPTLSLHLTARMALRRVLATLPQEGRDVLSKQSQEEAQRRLQTGRAAGDTGPLLDCADRFFPLDEAGEALLLAGDIFLERGAIAAATLSWRDLLERHPQPAIRIRAAKRLIATLSIIKDSSTALELARIIDAMDPPLEGAEELVSRAKAAAKEIEDDDLADCSVDGSGNVAPIPSAVAPGDVEFQHCFVDNVSKGFDWRSGEKPPQNEWQQVPPTVRRLLTGHLATDELLLVHLGKSILAYDVDESSDNYGKQTWTDSGSIGKRNVTEYFNGLMSTGCLLRYGITVHGRVGYATLKSQKEDAFPRGRLVAFRTRTGKVLWDTDKLDPEDEPRPKKKDEKGAADDDKKDQRLSFVGTPLLAGERVYCGATTAGTPNETFVTALEARSGRLIWKRALASTEAFTAQFQPWDQRPPRATPAPALTLALGALIVASNNGCLSAIDPQDGHFLWARGYERDDVPPQAANPWQRPQRANEADVVARGHSPVLAWSDLALAMPEDSGHLLVVRATDGTVLGKHGRSKFRYLLGVLKGRLILSGPEGTSGYLLHRKRSKSGVDTVQVEADWTGDPGRQKETGRGAIVGNWVYIPTGKEIVKFREPKDGQQQARIDHGYQWKQPKKEPGDLVVGAGRFFSISARHASAYKEEE